MANQWLTGDKQSWFLDPRLIYGHGSCVFCIQECIQVSWYLTLVSQMSKIIIKCNLLEWVVDIWPLSVRCKRSDVISWNELTFDLVSKMSKVRCDLSSCVSSPVFGIFGIVTYNQTNNKLLSGDHSALLCLNEKPSQYLDQQLYLWWKRTKLSNLFSPYLHAFF